MADNRRIKNLVRGEGGVQYNLGMEDQLAAAYDQRHLDDFKRAGAIEGDWTSTKTPLHVAGDVSEQMAGRLARTDGASLDGGEDNFEPLSIEETLAAMKIMDFSERVTRSMTFHGDALKEAMQASMMTDSQPKIKEPTGDDYPEGFSPLLKSKLVKLGKTYAEIKTMSREQLIDLDDIADKSADAILEFVKNHKEPAGEK